jgi:hypothetical protein
MMRLRVPAALGIAFAVAAAGCTVGRTSRTPMCSLDQSFEALLLEAQSVPSADRVPCIKLLPAGWSVFSADLERNRSQFTLSSDRAGVRAVRVTFTARCNTSGVTEITSDEPGTRRYERIESVKPGFAGTRYYTFSGGCAAYHFQFEEEGRALVNEASLALSFISRKTLDDKLREDSDGRDRL